MAFAQADLDTLKTAIAASGNAAEVRFDDGTGVKYHAIADLIALMRVMESDIQATAVAAATAAGTPVRARAFLGSFNSGW